jgi:hypothetical protein
MRYHVMSVMVMAAAIFLAVALQPLVTLIWPAIDSIAIGGLGASSYVPMFSSVIFTLTAGYWLRRTNANRIHLWVVLLIPSLWLALMLVILLRSPGPLALNRFAVFILLCGLFPVGSTVIGWTAAAIDRATP